MLKKKHEGHTLKIQFHQSRIKKNGWKFRYFNVLYPACTNNFNKQFAMKLTLIINAIKYNNTYVLSFSLYFEDLILNSNMFLFGEVIELKIINSFIKMKSRGFITEWHLPHLPVYNNKPQQIRFLHRIIK